MSIDPGWRGPSERLGAGSGPRATRRILSFRPKWRNLPFSSAVVVTVALTALCFVSAASEPPRGYPYPEWEVTKYTGLQDCAMATDASRVLAVENNALHVFDPAGAETASLSLPFTEVTGFWATPEAMRAVLVGWDGEDSRVLVATSEGRVLFTTTLPGSGEAFFARAAISPDGSTVAVLIANPGSSTENVAATPPAEDTYSIEFLSATGDRLWQTSPFDGGASMLFLMGNDFVLAGSTGWDWKKKTQTALSGPGHALSEPVLADDGSIASIDYTDTGPAVTYYSAAGAPVRSFPLPSNPQIILPASAGGVLYFDGRGYHQVDADGRVVWEHALSHPIQHDSMDLSSDGRFVAVSYMVSPMFRPAPQAMSQFDVLRFSHEFYVFDVDSPEPRWSLLPENPRLTKIRMSDNAGNWVVCGDNAIQAYHYRSGILGPIRDLGRRITRLFFGAPASISPR